jgi:hypothetical protein
LVSNCWTFRKWLFYEVCNFINWLIHDQLVVLLGDSETAEGNYRMWDLGGSRSQWGISSKNILSPDSVVTAMRWSALLYHMLLFMLILPHHRPRNNVPSDHGLTPWASPPQTLLSFQFSQAFCHSDRKFTNTTQNDKTIGNMPRRYKSHLKEFSRIKIERM